MTMLRALSFRGSGRGLVVGKTLVNSLFPEDQTFDATEESHASGCENANRREKERFFVGWSLL
jgi:hypothetical protein